MRAVPLLLAGTSQHPHHLPTLLPSTVAAMGLSSAFTEGQQQVSQTTSNPHDPGNLWTISNNMNDNHNSSSGMPPDATMPQTNGYNEAWANLANQSPYSQSPYQSPVNEYNHWGGYMPQMGLPSEQLGRMPHHSMSIPPTPQPHHHHMGHQQLPMLNTAWPSQLTNPTPTGGSYSAPPLSSMTPVSSASTQHSVEHVQPKQPPPTPASEKVRKTLSAEQKRDMCQYHEDHPNMRQADIGKRFGVERRYPSLWSLLPPFSLLFVE